MMILLHLTGGLGNQIFQIVRAIYLLQSNEKLEIEIGFGKPRKEIGQELPIISNFDLPVIPRYIEKKKSWLVEKSVNLILRLGTQYLSSGVMLRKFVDVCSLILQYILRIRWKEDYRILFGKGIGYTELETFGKKNNYLIGYFQSFHGNNVTMINNIIDRIQLKNYGPELKYLKERAKKVKPLVVHIRQGDYLNNPAFGILTSDYYKKVISDIYDENLHKEIWVFSQDSIDYIDYIPSNIKTKVLNINIVDQSDSSTFEAMRFGHDFVIANSTYSLCAAQMAFNREAKICVPNPWFKGIETPRLMYPRLCKLTPAVFENIK